MGADVDDGYLVRRAQEGYVDAYAELVHRHGQLAYRVALRLLGNHHDAEDVAQEALVTAWQQLPRFKANSSFSTWLYQIVTRKAMNRITRTRATESLDLLGDVSDASDQPGQHVERDLTVTPSPMPSPPCHRRSVLRSSCTISRDCPTPRSPASPGAPSRLSVATCSGEGAH